MDIGPVRPLGRLPHRPPFLFLDRILLVRPGEEAVGWKRIAGSDCPGALTWPRSLLVEVMAQTAASLVFPEGRQREGRIGVLAGVPEVTFFGDPRPGDTIVSTARIARRLGDVWRFAAEARIQGNRVAEGALLLATPRVKGWSR
jgi:3-hydroxyacyl-[acyl-carrier-protein] dehydratase